MALKIISDDYYFMTGLVSLLKALNKEKVVAYKAASPSITIKPGEVVLVDIQNTLLRNQFFSNEKLPLCRVVICSDLVRQPRQQKSFPWLVQRNCSFPALVEQLELAKRQPLKHTRFRPNEKAILSALGRGAHTFSWVSPKSKEWVFEFRSRMYKKYGMHRCNSAAMLFCRDLLLHHPMNHYLYK